MAKKKKQAKKPTKKPVKKITNRRVQQEEWEQIKVLYVGGMQAEKVAVEVGRNSATISRLINKGNKVKGWPALRVLKEEADIAREQELAREAAAEIVQKYSAAMNDSLGLIGTMKRKIRVRLKAIGDDDYKALDRVGERYVRQICTLIRAESFAMGGPDHREAIQMEGFEAYTDEELLEELTTGKVPERIGV